MPKEVAAVAVDIALKEGWVAPEAITYKDGRPYTCWTAIVRENPFIHSANDPNVRNFSA